MASATPAGRAADSPGECEIGAAKNPVSLGETVVRATPGTTPAQDGDGQVGLARGRIARQPPPPQKGKRETPNQPGCIGVAFGGNGANVGFESKMCNDTNYHPGLPDCRQSARQSLPDKGTRAEATGWSRAGVTGWWPTGLTLLLCQTRLGWRAVGAVGPRAGRVIGRVIGWSGVGVARSVLPGDVPVQQLYRSSVPPASFVHIAGVGVTGSSSSSCAASSERCSDSGHIRRHWNRPDDCRPAVFATTVAAAGPGVATDRFIQAASEFGEKSPEPPDPDDMPQPSAAAALLPAGAARPVSPQNPVKYPYPAAETGLWASSPASVLASLWVGTSGRSARRVRVARSRTTGGG